MLKPYYRFRVARVYWTDTEVRHIDATGEQLTLAKARSTFNDLRSRHRRMTFTIIRSDKQKAQPVVEPHVDGWARVGVNPRM